MSEDSGKPQQAAPQEIDLDNIEVEILVICKNPGTLNQAGSFLTRRGWPTTVVSDLTKAIEHLADKKPDFVLVSFSHPSPRISKIPDLITQTFNLTCLGFVENSDAQSNAKLANAKVRYKINGQASGPSIHRTIRKILAERFNIKTDEKSAGGERESKEKESGIVKVKGSGNTAAAGPGVIMQKSSANATLGKGAQMVKGSAAKGQDEDDDKRGSLSGINLTEIESRGSSADNGATIDDDDGYGGGSTGANEMVAAPGKRKSLKDLAGPETEASGPGNMLYGKNLGEKNARPFEKDPDLVGMLTKSLFGDEGVQAEDKGEGADTIAAGSTSANPATLGAGFDGSDPTLGVDDLATAAEEAQRKADEQAAQKNPGKKVPLMHYDPSGSNERAPREAAPFGESSGPRNSSLVEKERLEQARKAQQEEEKKRLEKEKQEQEEAEMAAKDPVRAAQTLMQKAVEAAMSRYCKTPPDTKPLPLEEITYVGVFPVDSDTVPGYLVIVWQAPDLSSREAFLRDCEVEIRSAFNSMKVNGNLGAGFWTQLPAVSFVAWADEKAHFNFMTAHQKREVGVAFFKTPSALPKPEPKAGMVALKVADMSTDVAVNFKAYIYLENNKKHFMYLRNGRKLQPEQKERLMENGVKDILLKSVDLENLRHYLAAGFLSGLIIEFVIATASASQSTRKTS